MIRPLVVVLLLTVSLNAASHSEKLLKNPDSWFISDEGKEALEHILSWQSEHGDWPKNRDTISEPYSGNRSKIRGTFDNGATTGELRVLARAVSLTKADRYEKAFHAGFDHILEAQYSNGGWPQYFPLRKGYYTRITFNDNCMIRLMEFLHEASTSEAYAFLNEERREAAQKAFEGGIECIVKCQVKVNGKLTVWCAQHHEQTLAPAGARSYELASLSGAESAGILTFLMTLDAPTAEVIAAVKAGVAWFESAKIESIRIEKIDDDRKVVTDAAAPPLWARFYEIETNRPFFCDRDGVVKYELAAIGKERRNGYAWYVKSGEKVAKAFADWKHR